MKASNILFFAPYQYQLIDLDHSFQINLPGHPVRKTNSLFRIRIGYVSYDFADHPLAHLLNSLFGLHDRNYF
jgi:predicted O-linked N-acetylglucosamine transferase (SPINDLY family)